jgi:hypothetical protein
LEPNLLPLIVATNSTGFRSFTGRGGMNAPRGISVQFFTTSSSGGKVGGMKPSESGFGTEAPMPSAILGMGGGSGFGSGGLGITGVGSSIFTGGGGGGSTFTMTG